MRPTDTPFVSKILPTAFVFSSLEGAILKALSTLFSNPLGTSGSARVVSYDWFQREADEYESDFMKKYDEDLNTALIFVSILSKLSRSWIQLVLLGVQAVCSLQLHPPSLSTFKKTFNWISNKSVTTSRFSPVSLLGTF